MKKLLIIALLIVISAGCRQKQEPKGQQNFGPNPMQTAEEVRKLQDIVKSNPSNAGAWTSLGNVLMDSARFQEAVDAYQQALALDPKNVDVRVDMGTCYRNSGKPDKAVQEYRKALEINPNHINAHRNLAVVLAYDLKDKAQAAAEFEKYVQLAPNAPDAAQIRQTIEELQK